MPRGRLLVLDDDPTVGSVLVFVAQSVDFEARLCEQAADFFEAIADWAPTHLAIDLSMPEMGGLEVFQRLAASACGARIIIASGAGRAEMDEAQHQVQALGLRVAGTLPKPFSVAALRALLADDVGAPVPP